MGEAEETKKPKKKIGCLGIAGIVIGVVILLGILANLGGGDSSAPATSSPPSQSSPAPATPPAPKKPNLELIDAHAETGDFGARYIVGEIKNNSNKQYSYVQVEINLYDDSGAQVGSTFDNLNNLEPGGIWRFKAFILEEKATKFKIKDITGF